jgi:hypothetical protein
VHDFVDQRVGQARPSGVDAMTHNGGGVRVGGDHDPAPWARATVLPWWQRLGCRMYPKAQQVLMTAAGGGRNGRRARLWQVAWQQCSDTTGREVRVCHGPPGTSTWNQMDPRLCGHIPQNWRGRPRVSHAVMVKLMANTTTEAGLRVEAALDPSPYETGQQVSDAELAQVHLDPADCHGDDWNDGIKPRSKHQ